MGNDYSRVTAVGRWCCTTRAWAVGFWSGSSALATGGNYIEKLAKSGGNSSSKTKKEKTHISRELHNNKLEEKIHHRNEIDGKSKSANQHCWKLFTKVSTVSFIWSWEFNTGGKVINISYTKKYKLHKDQKKRTVIFLHKEEGDRKDLENYFLYWAGK